MKRQIPVLLALLSILVWATAAQAEDNLLQDPSFETGTSSEAFDPAWSKFGNVYHELVTPRMSHWTAKLFGSFTGQVNYSGISQEIDAVAGAFYKASVYMRHNSDDKLEGQNEAFLRLEFLSADGEKLQTADSEIMTASTSPDVYKLRTVARTQAPEGSTRLRFLILFVQHGDGAPGAVFCDDALLTQE